MALLHAYILANLGPTDTHKIVTYKHTHATAHTPTPYTPTHLLVSRFLDDARTRRLPALSIAAEHVHDRLAPGKLFRSLFVGTVQCFQGWYGTAVSAIFGAKRHAWWGVYARRPTQARTCMRTGPWMRARITRESHLKPDAGVAARDEMHPARQVRGILAPAPVAACRARSDARRGRRHACAPRRRRGVAGLPGSSRPVPRGRLGRGDEAALAVLEGPLAVPLRNGDHREPVAHPCGGALVPMNGSAA